MTPTADQIKQMFAMQPHVTCGYFAQSYLSTNRLAQGALPVGFDGARTLASALYFLVTAEARTVLHRIRSDQIYHHYLGDPLEVLLLHDDSSGEVVTVGADLTAGMRPQLLVPAHTFHISRVRPDGDFAFMGTTAWPDVAPSDIEIGNIAALITSHAVVREQIEAFTRGHAIA